MSYTIPSMTDIEKELRERLSVVGRKLFEETLDNIEKMFVRFDNVK